MINVPMIYQPTKYDTALAVDVYALTPSYDPNNDMYNVVATGWCNEQERWITAPVWCFKPLKNKILNE